MATGQNRKKERKFPVTLDKMTHKNIFLLFILQLAPGNPSQ